jgi:hypothetical protein
MMFRRPIVTSAFESAVPGGQPELCDLCAEVVVDGSERYAMAPDSSAVHPSSSALDGMRRLVACSAAHLDELTQQYHVRPYDHDELLAHIVTRAQRRMGHDATLEDLVFITGLTMVQVMRATRWQSIWMHWLQDGDVPSV